MILKENTSSKQLTILIADNHALIRDAWSFMLNSDDRFRVVAQTGNGKELAELIQANKPDIVILDIHLQEMSCTEAISLIHQYSPDSKILGVLLHKQIFYVRKMIQKGIKGYITRNSRSDEMFKCIIEIYEGREYICEEIRDILAQIVSGKKDVPKEVGFLSEREMEVVEHIKKGYSSREIAEILKVSKKTIEVHRYNIMKKLKLKNVATLVNYFNNFRPDLREKSSL